MQMYSIFYLILDKISLAILPILIITIIYLVIKESIRNNKKEYYQKHYRTPAQTKKAILKEQEKVKKLIERKRG